MTTCDPGDCSVSRKALARRWAFVSHVDRDVAVVVCLGVTPHERDPEALLECAKSAPHDPAGMDEEDFSVINQRAVAVPRAPIKSGRRISRGLAPAERSRASLNDRPSRNRVGSLRGLGACSLDRKYGYP